MADSQPASEQDASRTTRSAAASEGRRGFEPDPLRGGRQNPNRPEGHWTNLPTDPLRGSV